MKSTLMTSVVGLIAAGAISCGGGANRADNTTTTTNNPPAVGTTGTNSNADTRVGHSENTFLKNAALDSMAEIEIGRMAQTKASSPAVKALARRIVQDHEQASTQLKQVAERGQADIPATLEGDQKDMVDKMAKLQGSEFDREYVNMMVDDHKKAVDDFRDQSKDNDKPDVQQFASSTLPKLEQHLQEAEQLQARLSNPGTAANDTMGNKVRRGAHKMNPMK